MDLEAALHVQRPCGRTEVVVVGDSDAREDRADREGCRAEGALGFLLVRWKRTAYSVAF